MTSGPSESENFYRDLPTFEPFEDCTDPDLYSPVPADWLVACADIEGSTRAIEGGRYKEVNLVSAAVIIAVLNAVGRVPIPYVFGGDGATVLIPPGLREAAEGALAASRAMARESFDLELRVGVVPARRLYGEGKTLGVAKLRLGPKVTQAFFAGEGLAAAEDALKDGTSEPVAAPAGQGGGDYTGLECRWQPVKSTRGEIVSLLIQSRLDTDESTAELFRDVLAEIAEIYGSAGEFNPVRMESLQVATSAAEQGPEASVRTFGRGALYRAAYRALLWWICQMGKWIFRWEIPAGLIHGRRYKEELVAHSDFRKFDGMLRMVLDGSAAHREKLSAFLEERARGEDLVYGLHSSSEALVTCMVFDQINGDHMHFVDGADGGYAVAAKDLKAKMG